MAPRAHLTNLYSKIKEEGGEQFSTVTIEATAPAEVKLSYPAPTLCQVQVRAALTMDPGPLYVQDGIIKGVTIASGEELVTFKIDLNEEVQARLTCTEGMPYRIGLSFSRRPLQDFYQGRVIVVDPGHGGSDTGQRGPVNLLERDMAWKTAGYLAGILEGLQARVVMTRSQDENPSWCERLAKVPADAFCFISCAAAVLGRLIKKRGLFYVVAGRQLSLIDDIAGTMYPYERHIVMGPKNPGQLVRDIKKATGAEAVIADVNDKKCVDILGITDRSYLPAVTEALRANPFGNEDEQTPIVILKRQ
ncbi:N-acetylmuramoyl-L-alanine amidase [Moorella naiadis]|uniref:N-acetylmuramoyl-L-alanine amidase n=1 Tax=Moorella naiadis (nom. illeg.) TaxID=3093670 RepID=UPI003D9CAD4C